MALRLLLLLPLAAPMPLEQYTDFQRPVGTGDCTAGSLRAHSLECGWWLDSSLLKDWRNAQKAYGLADTAADNLEAARPGVVFSTRVEEASSGLDARRGDAKRASK